MIFNHHPYLYRLINDEKKTPLACILRGILSLFSFLYLGLTSLLKLLYRSILPRHRLRHPVISIGNITWGGTGKTPLSALIAKYLKEQGKRPVVLMRGYRGGDESALLQRTVPVFSDAHRLRAYRKAKAEEIFDVVLLDDGMQQWSIEKNLEIVTINAANPFGNRRLIPRGPLREELSSLLRADIICLTRTDSKRAGTEALRGEILRLQTDAQLIEAIYEPKGFYRLGGREEEIALAEVKDRKAASLCGIGDPDSFRETLEKASIVPVRNFFFPDHYRYHAADLREVAAKIKDADIDTVLTTEKDGIRLKRTPHFPQIAEAFSFLALRIELKIVRGRSEFFERLSRIFSD